MPKHPSTVLIDSFKGINNVLRPEKTPQDYLKKAENVDIDKVGGIHKRKGYSKVDTGIYTSLWSSPTGQGCYGVKNGDLVRIWDDYSTETIRSGVGSYPISFEEVNNQIFYSSINVNGIIEDGVNRSWGIPLNPLSPTLTKTTGILNSGTYQVSFTYVSITGREGGAPVASTITVPDGSGISLYIPTPTDGDLIYARVYVSTRDGIELYYHGIAQFEETYTIKDVRENISILRTFNLSSAPLGEIVRYYKGRMFVVDKEVVYYSEPFQYEYFNLAKNFILYDTPIKEFLPVEDGIWAGGDKLYYLTGSNPEEFRNDIKENIEVIKGTSQKISGSYILMDNTPIGFKWLATFNLGIFVLFNQGVVINLTAQNIAVESANSGSSAFIQDNGMNQYLSILKTNENPNNSVIGDFVEAQIVRNGVIIT